jgi:hypothetical protein
MSANFLRPCVPLVPGARPSDVIAPAGACLATTHQHGTIAQTRLLGDLNNFLLKNPNIHRQKPPLLEIPLASCPDRQYSCIMKKFCHKQASRRDQVSTLDELIVSVLPNHFTQVPRKARLRAWFRAARISYFKANPAAIRGGGPAYYSVSAVERFLGSLKGSSSSENALTKPTMETTPHLNNPRTLAEGCSTTISGKHAGEPVELLC